MSRKKLDRYEKEYAAMKEVIALEEDPLVRIEVRTLNGLISFFLQKKWANATFRLKL